MEKRIACVAARTGLALLLATELDAQSYRWVQAAAPFPYARSGDAACFDLARGRTVFFGGAVSFTGPVLDETWEWDGYQWLSANPAVAPSARRNHAMVYDVARGKVLLFGGEDANGARMGDMWEWNGQSWSVRSGGPAARSRHAMAFDASRSVVVLFGGAFSNQVDLGDTWEWNGASWVPRILASSPPALSRHRLTYDGARGRSVMTHAVFGQVRTWEWDGLGWTSGSIQQVPFTLSSSSFQTYYDEGAARVVYVDAGSNLLMQWSGASWVSMQIGSGLNPVCASLDAAAVDARGALVVHGRACLETWQLKRFDVLASAAEFGVGCGAGPLHLVPSLQSPPVVGREAACSLANSPTSLAGATIGWDNAYIGPFPLPLDVSGLGLLGCFLLHSADVMVWMPSLGPSGEPTLILSIPADPLLLGFDVYVQAYAYAPMANAAEIVMSNGVAWRIGDF